MSNSFSHPVASAADLSITLIRIYIGAVPSIFLRRAPVLCKLSLRFVKRNCERVGIAEEQLMWPPGKQEHSLTSARIPPSSNKAKQDIPPVSNYD